MNTAHSLYTHLFREDPILLSTCEEIARQCPPEQFQERLRQVMEANTQRLRGIDPQTLDYPRLDALVRKRLAGLDLTKEDFSSMPLDSFDFSGSCLDYAILSHASLRSTRLCETNLCGALCTHATLTGADLHGANLRYACLRCADLTQANLEGAILYDTDCTGAFFGRSLSIDAKTTIDRGNHALISMVLLSNAQTVEQEQFALYIRHKTSLCWPGFTRLLVRQKHLAPWVQATLGSVASLEGTVREYAAMFQGIISERPDALECADIDPALDTLLHAAWERYRSLGGPDLFWYLSGVLTTACEQGRIHLSETQQKEVMARLERVTGWHDMDAEGE